MKKFADPLPEFLDSPIPILTKKRALLRVILNTITVFLFNVARWFIKPDGFFYERKFPWLFLSVIMTINLALLDNPDMKRLKQYISGTGMVVFVMVLRVGFILATFFDLKHPGADLYISFEFMAFDVSDQMIIDWCTCVVYLPKDKLLIKLSLCHLIRFCKFASGDLLVSVQLSSFPSF